MFNEGQQIGSYILINRLGKGGFGEVWLAEKRSQFVTKKVAVKLPLDEQVNFDAIRQEAMLWEQASGHANVLPIIDADVYDGQVVIVSEYADGGSLHDKLKIEGKLPVKQAVEMTIGILSGLEFLHNKRIIHRDIKPQNILLQGDTPRLADFGISRAMQTTMISSKIIGTDAYMSPETFEGKRSVQTDIWAVGVVLYQLLTGNLPFPQEHPTERMFAILMKDFESLTNDIPPELQKIIRTALAKNPGERFQTASAMQEDLRDFLYSVSPPVKTPPPPPTIESSEPLIEPTKPVMEQSFSFPNKNVEAVVPETIQVTARPYSQAQSAETIAFKSVVTQPTQDKKPKSLVKPIVIISLLLMLLTGFSAAGYFGYQKAVLIYQTNKIQQALFSGLSKEEMELLLEDANPLMLKRLKDDPEMKKQQIESLKQLFALANQAIKDGLVNDENTPKALEIMDSVIWAQSYDKEINKDKGPMPPFGFITENQVKEFYGEGSNATAEQKQHGKDFEEFLRIQTEFARRNGNISKDTEPSEEEKTQMRSEYAKIKIYEAEARAKVKSGELPEKFVKKVKLQSKLQQAQFLSRLYSTEVLAKKTEVTDDDIKKYLAEHPELNTAEAKRMKAEEVLRRVKNGEDFAKLAKEFSEDPGSKDKGGLYEEQTEGVFDKDFESAALALQPGQISPNLVETPFGYHIIKLEKKGATKDSIGQTKQKYSVRHILFSTMIKDPENPLARDMPIKDYGRSKLEEDKEKKVMDKIIADNPVTIAEDFKIRDVSDEEIQKSQQQQMQKQSNSNTTNSNK